MAPEFYNKYVENILSELFEMVKTRMLMKTELEFVNAAYESEKSKNEVLLGRLEKLERKKAKVTARANVGDGDDF